MGLPSKSVTRPEMVIVLFCALQTPNAQNRMISTKNLFIPCVYFVFTYSTSIFSLFTGPKLSKKRKNFTYLFVKIKKFQDLYRSKFQILSPNRQIGRTFSHLIFSGLRTERGGKTKLQKISFVSLVKRHTVSATTYSKLAYESFFRIDCPSTDTSLTRKNILDGIKISRELSEISSLKITQK